jgi:hypothetical protein
MATELNVLTSSIVAGESLTAELTGVSATGRTCVYQFGSATPLTVACDIAGDVFTLNLSAANTLVLRSGSIRFVALATTTATGAVECVDSGTITVEPSPVATSDYEAGLEAVEAAILNYAANPNQKVALSGMMVEYRSIEDLITLKSYYLAEIQRDKTGRGSGPMRIRSRFAF